MVIRPGCGQKLGWDGQFRCCFTRAAAASCGPLFSSRGLLFSSCGPLLSEFKGGYTCCPFEEFSKIGRVRKVEAIRDLGNIQLCIPDQGSCFGGYPVIDKRKRIFPGSQFY
jgi:hypothetical protein